MFFDTGDRVIDVYLQKLEGLAAWNLESDAEKTHQLLIGVIHIKEMLPSSVARHFDLPYLQVGNAHFVRGQEYRRKLIWQITNSLSEGLAKVAEDDKLRRQNKPDFSDRPRSKGEEILDALYSYQKERSVDSFLKLKMAAENTSLQWRLNEIAKLVSRKRPIGNQNPGAAIEGHLHRLESEAESYFDRKI